MKNNGKSYVHRPEIVNAFKYGVDAVPDWFLKYEADGFGQMGMIYVWHGDGFVSMLPAEFELKYQSL